MPSSSLTGVLSSFFSGLHTEWFYFVVLSSPIYLASYLAQTNTKQNPPQLVTASFSKLRLPDFTDSLPLGPELGHHVCGGAHSPLGHHSTLPERPHMVCFIPFRKVTGDLSYLE